MAFERMVACVTRKKEPRCFLSRTPRSRRKTRLSAERHVARIDDDAQAMMAQGVCGIAEAGSANPFPIHRGAAVRWLVQGLGAVGVSRVRVGALVSEMARSIIGGSLRLGPKRRLP
jgi:hypothetical protein